MKICDYCGAKATSKISFEDDHQEFDICETHKEMILDLLQNPLEKKQKPGRPKKEEATA